MNFHDFSRGAAINQRQVPMTLDAIRQAAPSAFAEHPFEGMSNRYTYIPTSAVIEHMLTRGFQVFKATQSLARIEGKKEFTKHMIRFRQSDTALAVGDVFPEVVLVNSHDGTSAYKLMGGLFRLACSNGLIVAESMIDSVRVKHTGNVIEEVSHGSISLVDKMPVCIDAIARWKEMQISQGEQAIMAEAAHAIRFADTDGKIDTPIQPAQLLRARRSADNANDLFTVFNRIQENVIQGKVSARAGQAQGFRMTTTRKVKGIDQDVKLNRALWTLTEKMAELHTAHATN